MYAVLGVTGGNGYSMFKEMYYSSDFNRCVDKAKDECKYTPSPILVTEEVRNYQRGTISHKLLRLVQSGKIIGVYPMLVREIPDLANSIKNIPLCIARTDIPRITSFVLHEDYDNNIYIDIRRGSVRGVYNLKNVRQDAINEITRFIDILNTVYCGLNIGRIICERPRRGIINSSVIAKVMSNESGSLELLIS